MNIAAKVRADKENNPENFCSDPRCLWRVATRNGIKPCPKHPQFDRINISGPYAHPVSQ